MDWIYLREVFIAKLHIFCQWFIKKPYQVIHKIFKAYTSQINAIHTLCHTHMWHLWKVSSIFFHEFWFLIFFFFWLMSSLICSFAGSWYIWYTPNSTIFCPINLSPSIDLIHNSVSQSTTKLISYFIPFFVFNGN